MFIMQFLVAEYVRSHCANATHGIDNIGRSPLHVAASCGKLDVLTWLLTDASSTSAYNINLKDIESGWTALHRAVYFGRVGCAIALLQVVYKDF